jgi:hypothetical protein
VKLTKIIPKIRTSLYSSEKLTFNPYRQAGSRAYDGHQGPYRIDLCIDDYSSGLRPKLCAIFPNVRVQPSSSKAFRNRLPLQIDQDSWFRYHHYFASCRVSLSSSLS